jgi:hypothetical protein
MARGLKSYISLFLLVYKSLNFLFVIGERKPLAKKLGINFLPLSHSFKFETKNEPKQKRRD